MKTISTALGSVCGFSRHCIEWVFRNIINYCNSSTLADKKDVCHTSSTHKFSHVHVWVKDLHFFLDWGANTARISWIIQKNSLLNTYTKLSIKPFLYINNNMYKVQLCLYTGKISLLVYSICQITQEKTRSFQIIHFCPFCLTTNVTPSLYYELSNLECSCTVFELALCSCIFFLNLSRRSLKQWQLFFVVAKTIPLTVIIKLRSSETDVHACPLSFVPDLELYGISSQSSLQRSIS